MTWDTKDPDDFLDYSIDWSARLDGDSISTSEWLDVDGLTFSDSSVSGTTTTTWILGGVAGKNYRVTNRVTTAAGRQMDSTQTLQVRER